MIGRKVAGRDEMSTLTKREQYKMEEWSIKQIQEALQNGELTVVELVERYIERIKQFDSSGPAINSVLNINPDALNIAADMDKAMGSGGQGPLFGVPILLKDNIETKDPMPTTAGAIALKDNYAKKDSWIAKKLREAGAIILGKTNMSEWAYFMSTKAPSGYSGVGGQVKNPYGPENFDAGFVGGSSSGSGASIASNFAVVSIGTETCGSILNPSSLNSIVGIKPTVGLISRSGIIPLALSQDTAGPMARTVRDAAITLGVLTGVDPADPITATSEGKALQDYTKHLKMDGLKGATIGVDPRFLDRHDEETTELKEMLNIAMGELQNLGAVIKEVEVPEHDLSSDVLSYEFKHQVNQYLKTTSDSVPVKTLKDIIAFNKEDPDNRMKYGQGLLVESEERSESLENPVYLKQRSDDVKLSGELGIDKVMEENGLDALLFLSDSGDELPAKAGYPSITVPAGYTKTGLPVGLTFSGLAYSEPKLIELAYSYEQQTKRRVPPKF